MTKSNEIRLGQLLVQKKRCSLKQVNEALLRQKRMRARNENSPLGQILIEAGVIDGETLREVLAEMGALQLSCPLCRVDYPIRTYDRNAAHRCPRCKELLVLNDPTNPAPPREAPPREAAADQGDHSRTDQLPAVSLPPEAPAPRQEPAPRAAEEAPANGRDNFVGKVLGGCQILERVAHGGMGVVYKAKQLNLGRTVAVKVLSEELSSDATFVRRFIQEARSAAQLSHGNIVHINDVGEYQGVFYFVMEFVDGKNLRDILKVHEKLDVARALEITIQVCHALRHAHNRGIIHRDIKPENIMITREGVVKLADLGLAKRMAAEKSASITHAGSILGTPFYMAPEQAKDFSAVDRRSDIYSLGVSLYRMITGKVPFDGRSPIEVMIKAIDGKKVPIRELREEVPVELEETIDKMMHRLPEKRFQEVDEVLRELTRVMALVAQEEPA
jgi:serine/threonine-protein kinase